jgi:hypothetical protein
MSGIEIYRQLPWLLNAFRGNHFNPSLWPCLSGLKASPQRTTLLFGASPHQKRLTLLRTGVSLAAPFSKWKKALVEHVEPIYGWVRGRVIDIL